MGVTLIIAIPTGALCGFLASRLPMPERQFDDTQHFHECEFGDDTAEFNKNHIKSEIVEVETPRKNDQS
jgi:hypothetical protein